MQPSGPGVCCPDGGQWAGRLRIWKAEGPNAKRLPAQEKLVGEFGQEVLGCRCAGGKRCCSGSIIRPLLRSPVPAGKTTHGHCGYHFHFMSNEDSFRPAWDSAVWRGLLKTLKRRRSLGAVRSTAGPPSLNPQLELGNWGHAQLKPRLWTLLHQGPMGLL